MNTNQKIAPNVILGISKPLETKDPKMTVANIKFAELKKVFDKFSR